ncbi:hypothetical protein BH23DEI1_BH23DEI1_09870 [soil metagenome]
MPDELVWFLSRSFAFLGHVDPHGLAQRLAPHLRDHRREAANAYVWEVEGAAPTAGIYVAAPDVGDDDKTLYLSQPWFEGAQEEFAALVREVGSRHVHEAVRLDLPAQSPDRVDRLAQALTPDGFDLDVIRPLSFVLSDTPPLGAPLVLEGWRPRGDTTFRELVARAEGWPLSDERWAWLKRNSGPFTPDLWFLASEAPDQAPIGYALCGPLTTGIEATFGLTAAGVIPEHRGSTVMLRRLMLTLLHELAAMSPLGRMEAELSSRDPKLIDILRSVGFHVGEASPVLRSLPE